jgi:serine/threonine-protein kinase
VIRAIPPKIEDGSSQSSQVALLHVAGGRVILEGIEFRLEPGDREGPVAALVADGADLTLKGCLFRLAGSSGSSSRVEAVHLRRDPAQDEPTGRPAPVVVRECHFDGGQVALYAEGPAEVRVLDSTMGPAGATPVFWFHNAGAPASVKADLDLEHVSILAGNGPIFRLERTTATIRLDDSIVAPPRDSEATLIATDDPDRLDWLGRGNLYARIGTYLLPTRALPTWQAITEFDAWGRTRSARGNSTPWPAPRPSGWLPTRSSRPAGRSPHWPFTPTRWNCRPRTRAHGSGRTARSRRRSSWRRP